MGVAIMGVAHRLGDKENKTTIVDKSFLPFLPGLMSECHLLVLLNKISVFRHGLYVGHRQIGLTVWWVNFLFLFQHNVQTVTGRFAPLTFRPLD